MLRLGSHHHPNECIGTSGTTCPKDEARVSRPSGRPPHFSQAIGLASSDRIPG